MPSRLSIEGTADYAVQELLSKIEDNTVRQCYKCGIDIIPAKLVDGRWRDRGSAMLSGFDGHAHKPPGQRRKKT